MIILRMLSKCSWVCCKLFIIWYNSPLSYLKIHSSSFCSLASLNDVIWWCGFEYWILSCVYNHEQVEQSRASPMACYHKFHMSRVLILYDDQGGTFSYLSHLITRVERVHKLSMRSVLVCVNQVEWFSKSNGLDLVDELTSRLGIVISSVG